MRNNGPIRAAAAAAIDDRAVDSIHAVVFKCSADSLKAAALSVLVAGTRSNVIGDQGPAEFIQGASGCVGGCHLQNAQSASW